MGYSSQVFYGLLLTAVLGGGCFLMILWRRRQTRERTRLMMQREALEEQACQMQHLIAITKDYQEEIRRQMETALDDESLANYIRSLEESREEWEELPTQHYCDNNLIQTMLIHKQMECRRKKIGLQIEALGLDDLVIADLKLISILYNLFDNAMEACEKLAEPEERWIRITTEPKKRSLQLRFENSCQKIQMKKDPFATWKSNPEEHGLGLGIIRDLVLESRGTVRFAREESSFLAEVTLPTKKVAAA